MKTAESYALTTPWIATEDRLQIIKQIQLDAAKWGMEQAALKLHSTVISAQRVGETWQGYYQRIIDTQKDAILTFANNLTIEQLPK